MKKTIIFDFDGTIADTFTAVVEIANRLADVHHYKKADAEEVKRLQGQGPFEILKELHIPLYKVPFILKDGKEELEKSIHAIKLIEGMEEVVRTLKMKGYKLGIASSNSRTNIEKFLKKHKMDFFDFIHCDISILGKAGVLGRLLTKYNLKPEGVIYIGDEVRDIQAAQRNEIEIISVTWGFNTRALLKEEKPNHLVDTPAELLKILTKKT